MSPRNSKPGDCTGRAFDANIRRERSASIGCVALARPRRPRSIHQLPCPLLGLPELTDAHWEQLLPLLPPQKPRTGRPAIDHRLVVEGMLWVARTGSSWRELPERFGPWSTVSSRYQRWCKEGCGNASCRSCFRPRFRSGPPLDSYMWDCSTRGRQQLPHFIGFLHTLLFHAREFVVRLLSVW